MRSLAGPRLFFALFALLIVQPAPARAQDAVFFDLAGFFEGSSVSAGTTRTLVFWREVFTARFEGRRAGNRLHLEERFAFPEGARLQVWDLTQQGPRLSGSVRTERADGSLGEPVPVEGERTSDGVVLRYLGIAPGGGRFKLAFRHEMRRNADGTLGNHVRVSRLGVPLAVSDVVFAKTMDALSAHVSNER